MVQSPASRAERTSARVNQSASAISPSLNAKGCEGSPIAWKPSMMDRGKGHGWLPRYCTSVTVRPTSSATSRATHASSDSPASTNPASSENIRSGQNF
ncbi:Uncharacterised protein [Mycobacteroides abscessus subsp. abscessus]|nr:Uncharacterised protein [Mycobacteroides abscessus subsp. abscessus]